MWNGEYNKDYYVKVNDTCFINCTPGQVDDALLFNIYVEFVFTKICFRRDDESWMAKTATSDFFQQQRFSQWASTVIQCREFFPFVHVVEW